MTSISVNLSNSAHDVNSELHANLADVMSILADLEQARDCAKLINYKEYSAVMRVQRALYESALISYRRAFNNASTRLPSETRKKVWRFTEAHHLTAREGLTSDHKKLISIADQSIAHRASADARRIEIPKKEGAPLLITKYTEQLHLIKSLEKLAERYCKLIIEKIIPEMVLKIKN